MDATLQTRIRALTLALAQPALQLHAIEQQHAPNVRLFDDGPRLNLKEAESVKHAAALVDLTIQELNRLVAPTNGQHGRQPL